jgi:hypothetical protein
MNHIERAPTRVNVTNAECDNPRAHTRVLAARPPESRERYRVKQKACGEAQRLIASVGLNA